VGIYSLQRSEVAVWAVHVSRAAWQNGDTCEASMQTTLYAMMLDVEHPESFLTKRCPLQAVHSGDDLASATQRVLGFSSRSRKGKEVTVAAVPQLATPRLAALLAAVQAADAAPLNPEPFGTGGGAWEALEAALAAAAAARAEIAAALPRVPEDRLR
jgi:hypothetical protein